MCFRFLQVTASFIRTGELPHHDHGHVDGIDEATIAEEINAFEMEDNLHPHDLTYKRRHPEDQTGQGGKK
jgi:C4-dicarboxylate transporter DctQ subunit